VDSLGRIFIHKKWLIYLNQFCLYVKSFENSLGEGLLYLYISGYFIRKQEWASHV